MSSGGVPHDDMPNQLKPERRDSGALSDAAVAALLAGTEMPAGAAPLLRPVADVLAALRSGPGGDELAGEALALAEFRRSAGAPAASAPARRRRRPLAGYRLRARAAVAAAVAVLSLGGLATAAYAGVLPGPMQRFAHDTIGAPAAHGGPPTARPGPRHMVRHTAAAGPSAAGPAAHGLCTAYARAKQHGNAQQQDVALHNLIRAAGGAGRVTAFCRTGPGSGRPRQPHPGQAGAGGHGKAGQHGQGNPSGQHGQGGNNGQNGQGGHNGQNGHNGQGGNNGHNGQGGNNGHNGQGGHHGQGGHNGQSGQQRNGRPHQKAPPGKRRGLAGSHSQGKQSAQRTGRGEPRHAYRPDVALLRFPHGTERSPRART